MRRLVASLALALLVAACGKQEPSGPSASAGPSSGGVAADVAQAKQAAGTANGRCPVLVDQLVDPDAEVVHYHDPVSGQNVKVGFCCDKCPAKFRAEPEKFMAKMRADPARFGYAP